MIVKLGERMVVYKTLYEREDKKKLWIRPEKCFYPLFPKDLTILLAKHTDLNL